MDAGQAKYSYTDGSVFSLPYVPRVGTPVAGVGWWTEKTTVCVMPHTDPPTTCRVLD